MIVLLTIAFLGVVLFEVPDLIRKKHWRELIAFSVFLSLAFGLAVLQIFGVKIPSPIRGIVYLIKDVLHLSYK